MNDLQSDIPIVTPLERPKTPARRDIAERPLLVERLLAIAKSMRVVTALQLERIGLNAGQDQFLDVLGEEENLTVGEAALRLNVRPSTVSKMADRLCGKGLVERLEDDTDARRTRLCLTEAGRDMRDDVHDLWRQIEVDLGRADARIGGDEIDGVLETIETALKRRLSRLR